MLIKLETLALNNKEYWAFLHGFNQMYEVCQQPVPTDSLSAYETVQVSVWHYPGMMTPLA